MTFRARLTLFFLVIVVVPMLTVGVLVFVLIADNENGKADARAGAGQAAAVGLYREFASRAAAGLGRAARDAQLIGALRSGNTRAAAARAAVLRQNLRLTRIAVQRDGGTVVDVGDRAAIAAARSNLVGTPGSSIGRLEVSALTAPAFIALFKQVSPLGAVVREGDRSLASTLRDTANRGLPKVGDATVDSTKYRVASFDAPGFGDRQVRVSVLSNAEASATAITRGRVISAAALVAFLLVACAFAYAVSRSLQDQVARLLAAARRLAAGDFSTPIRVEGRDEFAQLGEEFNKMSRQLSARLEELRQQRTRLDESFQRTAETFASNLDREGLLESLTRTVASAASADCARASLRERNGHLHQRAGMGDLDRFQSAIGGAEAAALRSRRSEQVTGQHSALAVPLTRSDAPDTVLGMVSVARRGRAFSTEERDRVDYLAGQAAVSLENVGLHEQARRQAVTDGLTGLFNHRRFQEVIDEEVLRSQRLGQELGLLMLDIDDFKQFNDTFGHPQGDLVLREVAQVLRDSSREIDEPARYGGEELAVALPGTDLDGAFRLAERIRERIAALNIPRVDGPGTLNVTASFGVAAMPGCADNKDDLIAAADGALFRAKRAGKNRTERANGLPFNNRPA